jgi:hypothetical protein
MSRKFDAIDDVIDCGTAAGIDQVFTSGGGGTVAAWIYKDGSGENNNGYICSKLATNEGWTFTVTEGTGAGRIAFLNFFSGNDLSVESTNNTISTLVWTHLAVTWDGGATATNVHIYKNGVEVSYALQQNGTLSLQDDTNQSFMIGNRSTTDRTFNGKIAHVHAYKGRQLSIQEVNQILRFPGSIQRNLAGYWPLIGGSPEPDYSGKGNNGAVTGALYSTESPAINAIFTLPIPMSA